MKKLLLSICLIANVLLSFAAQTGTYKSYVITSAGGTFVTAPANIPDVIYLTVNGATTLSNDFVVNSTSYPATGSHWRVYFNLSDLNVNGHVVIIFGYTLNPPQRLTAGYYDFWITGIAGTPALLYNYAPYDFNASDAIYGGVIQDSTIPLSALESAIPLSSLDTTGRGRIIRGGPSNVTQSYYAAGSGKILIGDGTDIKSFSVSGDVSLSNAGVTAIDSVIVDADIKTYAAIKRQKLATGTASYVCVNTAAGYLSEEQYLQPIRGGTGINTNASNGFATVGAGTWAVGALTDIRDLHVSFATNSLGTYYITFPVAVTVTAIEARVELALAATDSATIQCQNDAGTAMVGSNLNTGLLVLAASATTGTGYTSTLTANNTFTAGQRMRLITNKGTVGGTANVQITYTRLN